MERSQMVELIAGCLQAAPGPELDARIEALSNSDWDLFIVESIRKGVAPLLYYRLRSFHSNLAVPARVMEGLRQAHLENSARNLGLYHKLGQVLEIVRRAGLPVIVLKGAHLADAVYRSTALRPMADVDLLVKLADLGKLHDILTGQGYVCSKEEIGCDPKHLPPYTKEASLPIEVHFSLIDPPLSDRVDMEKLWARAQPVSIRGVEALALCPADLLLQLCAHAGLKHGFGNGLVPLFDIAHIVERYQSEPFWEEVLNRGGEWGVTKCVYLALSLAKKYAGAPVPGQIFEQLGVFRDGLAAVSQAEGLLLGRGGPVGSKLAGLFYDNNLRDKLALLQKCVFPPKTTMLAPHPAAGNPLAVYPLYFYRLRGLFKRHGRIAWRLFRQDEKLVISAKIENSRNELKDWLVRTNEPPGSER